METACLDAFSEVMSIQKFKDLNEVDLNQIDLMSGEGVADTKM
jgi:hypothetical protein